MGLRFFLIFRILSNRINIIVIQSIFNQFSILNIIYTVNLIIININKFVIKMETEKMLNLLSKDFNDIQLLIQDDENLIREKDRNDRTILHWAALQGKERLVEYILENFKKLIEIDQRDDVQATPLILATLGGNLNIVKMLLNNGADINARNWNGHSSLQYACSKGWHTIVEYLLENNADINIRDKYGDTCLHRTVVLGRLEILQLLLNHTKNLNVNCQNIVGNTPLFVACEDEQSSCALLLIEHGADVNIENKEKLTALNVSKTELRNAIKKKLNLV